MLSWISRESEKKEASGELMKCNGARRIKNSFAATFEKNYLIYFGRITTLQNRYQRNTDGPESL